MSGQPYAFSSSNLTDLCNLVNLGIVGKKFHLCGMDFYWTPEDPQDIETFLKTASPVISPRCSAQRSALWIRVELMGE